MRHCARVVCGDGHNTGGVEACDDNNTASGDGCSGACAVEPGYVCGGGNTTHPDTCVFTGLCGDGTRTHSEACDDGNAVGGDGCSGVCSVEAGYACAGVAPDRCGDGSVCPNGAAPHCSDDATVHGGCASVLAANASAPTGVYWVVAAGQSIQVYCYMGSSGGWALAARITARANTAEPWIVSVDNTTHLYDGSGVAQGTLTGVTAGSLPILPGSIGFWKLGDDIINSLRSTGAAVNNLQVVVRRSPMGGAAPASMSFFPSACELNSQVNNQVPHDCLKYAATPTSTGYTASTHWGVLANWGDGGSGEVLIINGFATIHVDSSDGRGFCLLERPSGRDASLLPCSAAGVVCADAPSGPRPCATEAMAVELWVV